MAEPQETTMVLALADVMGFAKACEGKSDLTTFNMLNKFYALVVNAVDKADGTVVKFMGDCALVVFPKEKASQAVASLREVVSVSNDAWSEFDVNCSVRFKTHLGSVVLGPMGPEKRLDVIGRSLNHLFLMPWDGPEVSDELKHRR